MSATSWWWGPVPPASPPPSTARRRGWRPPWPRTPPSEARPACRRAIENYLGFPAGLSGEELAARAALQAQKFGVCITLASKAISLSSQNNTHAVTFESGEQVTARSLIIATGARYNRLPLDRLPDFEGVGVYYAATQMEAQACGDGPVVIVGGGNSAGQAALFLASTCTRVHIVIRGGSLDSSMSRYLLDQIERVPHITVTTGTQVSALIGTTELESVELVDAQGRTTTLDVSGLFVFIGARPSTEWLGGQLAQDEHGFLLTGTDIPPAQRDPSGGNRSFSRRAGRASSVSETSAAARSSGRPPPSARAPWPSGSSSTA